jgi:hypothetical protein
MAAKRSPRAAAGCLGRKGFGVDGSGRVLDVCTRYWVALTPTCGAHGVHRWSSTKLDALRLGLASGAQELASGGSFGRACSLDV